jgi:hypothetical protein
MIQKHLNLHFPDKLVSYFLLMQQFLFDYLESTNEVGVFILHKVNSTIFATSELFDLHKIIYGYFLLLRLGCLSVQLKLTKFTLKSRL